MIIDIDIEDCMDFEPGREIIKFHTDPFNGKKLKTPIILTEHDFRHARMFTKVSEIYITIVAPQKERIIDLKAQLAKARNNKAQIVKLNKKARSVVDKLTAIKKSNDK